MVLMCEMLIILAAVTVVDIIGMKRHSLMGLHNWPVKIQERVRELPQYKDKVKGNVLTAKQRIIRKLPALIVVLAAFWGLIYLAGARDFLHGMLYSLILWVVIKLYVTLVLQCLVLAGNRSFRIPGTEDLEQEWSNRKFYLSSIPRSLAAGVIVSLIIGLLSMIKFT